MKGYKIPAIMTLEFNANAMYQAYDDEDEPYI